MKTLIWIVSFAFLALVLAGCASQIKILDSEWASMKYTEAPDISKVTRVSSVKKKHCVSTWSGTYGLMDEVLKEVERDFNVDYVRSASFTMIGKNCMVLEGDGYRTAGR